MSWTERGDSWGRYERMVLARLESLEQSVDRLREEMVATRIAVAKLQVKAGLIGALAGSIPGLLAALALLL